MSALVWPLTTYTLSSPYGPRSGGFHYGDDLAAPLGTPIYASGDGTVVAAGKASGFGCWIVIDHVINGQKVSTVYGHEYPSGLHVVAGQVVKQGSHIGDVGANGEATGPHCHFEVWPGGRLTGGHAVDPATMVGGTTTGMATTQQVDFTTENVDNGTPGIGTIWDTLKGVVKFVEFIINPHNWWRAFLFLVGFAFVCYVIWSMMQNGGSNG